MADRGEEMDLVADIITKTVCCIHTRWQRASSRRNFTSETLRSNRTYAVQGNNLHGQRQGI